MKYCTDDGKKVFDTQEEYNKYIEEENAKRLAEAQKAKYKKKRADEIVELSKQIKDKISAYRKDYGENIPGVAMYLNDNKVLDKYLDDLFGVFPFTF